MKPLSILAAILVVSGLSAQERSASPDVRVLVFEESIQTRSILLAPGVSDQADRQAGTGVRFQGQFLEESPWVWELSGRFQSSAHMVTDRDISSAPPANVLDARGVKIYYSYWSVGAGYLLPLGSAADLGFHLEGRAETINPKGSFSTTAGGTVYLDSHNVYWRPWVRLDLDFKIPTGSVKTVIGAEIGAATLKTSQKAIVPLAVIDKDTMRALAPTWSGAVYVGVQF